MTQLPPVLIGVGATYTVETDRTLEGVLLTRGDAASGTGALRINGVNFLYWEQTAAGGAVFVSCNVPLFAGDTLHTISTGGLSATMFFGQPNASTTADSGPD